MDAVVASLSAIDERTLIKIRNTTAPLMTYLLRSALRRERPDVRRGCGISLGFVGVALLFVPRQALPDPSAIGWLALGFLTPLMYTLSNLAIERLRPPGEDSMALWHVNMALHNHPRFLDAIRLKERLTQVRLWDSDGTGGRAFLHQLIAREKGYDLNVFGRPKP